MDKRSENHGKVVGVMYGELVHPLLLIMWEDRERLLGERIVVCAFVACTHNTTLDRHNLKALVYVCTVRHLPLNQFTKSTWLSKQFCDDVWVWIKRYFLPFAWKASFSPPPPSPSGDICLGGVLLLQFPFHEITHPFSVHTSKFLHLHLSILHSYIYQVKLKKNIGNFTDSQISKSQKFGKLNFFRKFKTFEK